MRVTAGSVLGDHDPTKKVFDGEELPFGKYLTKLIKAEDGTSADGQWSWINCWFEVIDGDYLNRKAFVKFFEPQTDEKAKQFASNLYQSFGLDIREYPEGIDVTEYLQQFVYGGTNADAPTFVITVKKGSTNPKTKQPYVNHYISMWDGSPVNSPTRGGTPEIPGVPTGAQPPKPPTPQAAPVPTPQAAAQPPKPSIARPKNPLFGEDES